MIKKNRTMKKYLYSLAALSMLLFASCADETYESGIPQSGNAISFQIDTPVTRATPVVKSNIADIYKTMDVTAADADGNNPFPDTNATTFTISNGENNKLVASAISPIRYWPAAGDALNFFVTPSANKACMKDIIYSKPSGSTGGSYSFTFTQPVTLPTEEGAVMNNAIETPDLIFATAYGAKKGKPVNLTFNHALTAVKVKYAEPINSHKIKSINVKGAYTTGVCTVNNDGSFTWSGQRDTATLNQVINHENIYSAGELIGHVNDEGKTDESATFMLIPGGDLDLYVTMIEKNKDGKDIEVKYPLTSNTKVKLVAGQTVVINLKDQVKTNDAVPTNKVIESYVENDQTLYKITIDAWVTGEVETKTVSQPLDVVLVLDMSGSMDEDFSNQKEYIARSEQAYSYTDLRNKTYYYLDNGVYYKVNRGNDSSSWGLPTDCYIYYVKDGQNNYLYGTSVSTDKTTVSAYNTTIWTGVLYENRNPTRLDALKESVGSFIDEIESKSTTEATHQISIVTFANKNNSKIVSELTSDFSSLKAKVEDLSANGGTIPSEAMTKANTILSAVNSNRKSSKLVVMFTDGVPDGQSGDPKNKFSNDNKKEASATILASKTLKDNKISYKLNDDGTYTSEGITVYSVGIFTNPFADIVNYMDYVSSNYPTASSMDSHDDAIAKKKYSMTASSAEALNEIFNSIAQASGGASVTLDSETKINDTMSNVFVLPNGIDASNASQYIKCYAVPCTSINEDGSNAEFDEIKDEYLLDYSFGDGDDDEIFIKGKTVTVTGFDFSANYCARDKSNPDRVIGKKLVIVISGLKLNEKYKDGDLTNMAGSGVYDKDGNLISEFAPNSLPSSGTSD